MSTKISSAALDVRRRRILYRAWHRGMQEMDIVMGSFADAELVAMNDHELDVFEALLDCTDQDLFLWVSGAVPVPPIYDTPVFARMKSHKVY